MANVNRKFHNNAPGAYYVDDSCICCDACVSEAPDFFEMDEDEGHSFVKKQPQTEKEIEICESALAACPVEAIGNNG